MQIKTVAIIGQGYVGLTIAKYAARHYRVIGFDTNARLIEKLNSGESHIEGIKNSELKAMLDSNSYYATSSENELREVEIVIIAVPTPLDANREPDLVFIESACETIGRNLTRSALVINESTSFPGTLRNFIKPTIEKHARIALEHEYAISPERVDPGREDFNQENTPRIYAGLSKKAAKTTRDFYSHFCTNLIEVSKPEVAEAAKLFENTFRQVNIALVNEFAKIAHAIDIDVNETLNAAATKPYGFMKFNPSAGVGGHCIPVDPTYLAQTAEKNGVTASFIRLANEVNLSMPSYIVERIKEDLGSNLSGKKIMVLGVAYKPNVADTRETPAEKLIEILSANGAIVVWNDDLVKNWRNEVSSNTVDSDISIVLTRHDYMSKEFIMNSSKYIFDTTGSVPGVRHL